MKHTCGMARYIMCLVWRAVSLRSALTTLQLAPLAALHAAPEARPTVGAIRWDGWYGGGSVVKAVEASLGQPKYHFRLPWFAQVIGPDKVSINGDSPAVVEQEIAYAARAGLNYWAFVHYWDEAPGMSIGLNRYRAAPDKRASATASSRKAHGSTKSARAAGASSWSTSGSLIIKRCSRAVRCCSCS